MLFVCGRNRLRSPTAERIFAIDGFETESAGVAPDAESPLEADVIDWADIVLFMESRYQTKATRRFGPALRGKRVVCLHVPDRFEFMAPELVDLLWQTVPRVVPALAGKRGT